MYDLYCGSSNSLSVGIIAQRRFIVASNIQGNVVYYNEKSFQASAGTDYLVLLCHILKHIIPLVNI